MGQSSDLKKTFKVIQKTKDFAALDPFREPSCWGGLEAEDKVLLAHLFTLQGEEELQEGTEGTIEAFECAKRLLPDYAPLLVRQAQAYANGHVSQKNLEIAHALANEALCLAPQDYDVIITAASVLVLMSMSTEQADYAYKALEYFSSAFWHPEFSERADQSEFFWQWGLCFHYLAKISGEPSDYQEGIKKYEKAMEQGARGVAFYNDYANALVDLSYLVNNHELLIQASELYHELLEEDPDFFEGWFNLACCEQRIWQITREEKNFHSANEAFERSFALRPDAAMVLYKWGVHLSLTGRERGLISLLEAAAERFKNAYEVEPGQGYILSFWAETLLHLGILSENVDYLKEASQKIQQAINEHPDVAEHRVVYGSILIEIGHYFGEASYYGEAIEVLTQGLVLSDQEPMLWYTLARALFFFGKGTSSREHLLKSIRYFARAQEFGGEMFLKFWNEWGVALMKVGDLDQDSNYFFSAIEKFEHAIRLSQLHGNIEHIDPDLLYNYGCAMDFLGECTGELKYYEKAVKILSQALALAPDHPFVKFNLASALTHLGGMVAEVECYQRAVQLYQEVTEINNEDEHAFLDWGIALMHLAELVEDPATENFSDHLYKEAEEKFQRAAILGNVEAYYHLACLHGVLQNIDVAITYLQKAQANGALPALEDLIHDEWLTELRSTNEFRVFLLQLKNKQPE